MRKKITAIISTIFVILIVCVVIKLFFLPKIFVNAIDYTLEREYESVNPSYSCTTNDYILAGSGGGFFVLIRKKIGNIYYYSDVFDVNDINARYIFSNHMILLGSDKENKPFIDKKYIKKITFSKMIDIYSSYLKDGVY